MAAPEMVNNLAWRFAVWNYVVATGLSEALQMNRDWQEATSKGNIEKVLFLLNNGADIDSRDQHGQTALMNAAQAGRLELVHALVERRAALNITAKYNLSALMLAIISRQTEVAQLLIESGADLNIRGRKSYSGKTAFALAQDAGQSKVVILLKQKNAS